MHNPRLQKMLIDARAVDLRRAAARSAASRPQLPERRTEPNEWVTLRYAFPDDAQALSRLATLDNSDTLLEPVLVAEVSGSLRVALSLADGRVIADPFHPSAALTELLSARARQLRGRSGGRRRRAPRLLSRLGLATWR